MGKWCGRAVDEFGEAEFKQAGPRGLRKCSPPLEPAFTSTSAKQSVWHTLNLSGLQFAFLSGPLPQTKICLSAMHPRSAADILASATFAPPRKSRKPAKAIPLASDIGFSKFSSAVDVSPSVPQLAPRDANPLSPENPYIPPFSFKLTPTSTPDTFLTSRKEEAVRVSFDEFGHITPCIFY